MPANVTPRLSLRSGRRARTIKTIRALFDAGVDAFRLNFSHGSHKERVDIIRRIEEETGRPIAILLDCRAPSRAWARSPKGR